MGACMGGTEILVAGLQKRLGDVLERINLCVNLPKLTDEPDPRPMVVWIHHDIDQPAVQWLDYPDYRCVPDRFVFGSHYQRDQFIARFALPAAKCIVFENVADIEPGTPQWPLKGKPVCGYVSTPYRGLALLLGAWDMLKPDAELHVYSSMKIYGLDDEDEKYTELYDWARELPGVTYHGSRPNDEIRAFWRTCHFMTYPNIFREMGSVAVAEAMSAGVRIICPRYGALPDSTHGWARDYDWTPDQVEHVKRFAGVLASELRNPWGGRQIMAQMQQDYARERFSWDARAAQWRSLIVSLTKAKAA